MVRLRASGGRPVSWTGAATTAFLAMVACSWLTSASGSVFFGAVEVADGKCNASAFVDGDLWLWPGRNALFNPCVSLYCDVEARIVQGRGCGSMGCPFGCKPKAVNPYGRHPLCCPSECDCSKDVRSTESTLGLNEIEDEMRRRTTETEKISSQGAEMDERNN